MIVVDKTIISDDIFLEKFVCDLSQCLGTCCVDGDAGAPLEEEEVGVLEEIFHLIKPYMTPEGIEEVEKNGVFDYDGPLELVTPLINKRECAYISYNSEDGIALCAIEKAYFDKVINFRKPISCHLYPIRISKHRDYEALNYDRWHICKSARINGAKLCVPIYKFLIEPLIRKYGQDWYSELEKQIEHYDKK